LTPEDVAAARRDGDLARLVLLAGGLAPAPAPRPTEPETVAYMPRSGPAWPYGTRRPGPLPEVAAHLSALWGQPGSVPLLQAAPDDGRNPR
jgi:hypothetical protein